MAGPGIYIYVCVYIAPETERERERERAGRGQRRKKKKEGRESRKTEDKKNCAWSGAKEAAEAADEMGGQNYTKTTEAEKGRRWKR